MYPMLTTLFDRMKLLSWLKSAARGFAISLLSLSIPNLVYAQTALQQPTLAEGILVSVNNDIISSYDLKQRIQLLMVTSEVQVTQENFPVIQQQALRSLVDERLKLQELAHWKVEVTDEDIDEEINRMASQSGLTGDQLVLELAKVGVDATTLRSQIKAEIGWNMLVGGRFRSNARVGKDQIDATMEKLIDDSQKTQYEVAEIFLDFAIVGSQEDAIEGANQLYNQLVARVAPFQKVAQQFSNAPSAANGGMAGFMVSGEIDPVIETTLSQLQPNQISKPITTKEGVYIFYLISKTNGHSDLSLRLTVISTPATISDKTPNQLLTIKPDLACSTVRNNQRNDFNIVDLGEVNLSDLKPEYDPTLRNLRIGQATPILKTSNGFHRLVVCDRRVAGDEAPTRESVEHSLVNRRLGMLGKRYLRDLRNAATIEYHY